MMSVAQWVGSTTAASEPILACVVWSRLLNYFIVLQLLATDKQVLF